MKRLKRLAVVAAAVLGTVAVVMAVLIVILGFVVPETVTRLDLGMLGLRAQVTETTGSLVQHVRLNPLVDIALVLGSYAFVSLLGWAQDRVAFYVRERRHFE